MTMWDFFSEHGFLAWCALWGIWPAFGVAHALLFRLPNRILRTVKVLVRGWPPEHLDADGDHKPDPLAADEVPS
jgi:hypothetical protein